MMKYGLAVWGLRQTPLPEQLSMAKRLGVDLLELGINGYPTDFLQADASAEQTAAVRKMFESGGVQLLCATTGNDFTQDDETDVLKSLDTTLKAVRIADALGIKYLRIFAGFAPFAEIKGRKYELLMECLKSVYNVAANGCVLPVVETHGGVQVLEDGSVRHFESISTDENSLDKMLEEIPEMRLNFDPANLHVLGKDVALFFKKYREKISYIHLKDFVPCGMGERPAACGESDMDWQALLSLLKDFDGPQMLEYEIPEDVEDGFRRSLNFLRGKGR